MPRPIQIDRQQALGEVRDLFWRQGFYATPMSQLLETTGMGAGSFYAAFGKKRDAFSQALTSYADFSIAALHQLRQEHNGLDALQIFLTQTLFEADRGTRQRGCFVINSITELAGGEDDLYVLAKSCAARFHREFSLCVHDAYEQKQLRPGLSAQAATGLLLTFFNGLRVDSRLNSDSLALRQRTADVFNLISRTPVSL